MILRGSTFAAEAVRVTVEERKPQRTSAAGASAAAEQRAPQPALNLSLVQEWLARQGSEVRRALAAALADEISAEYAAARERGAEQGRDEAEARAKEELAAQVASLERLGRELEAAFEKDRAALEASCAEIVMEALHKVAGPLLAAPDAVTGAVVQVLQRLKDGHEIVIKVCPADLEVLRAAEDVLARALGGASFELVPDRRVELGGCIVESKLGNLDGRLEIQLNELYETLRVAKAEGRAS